MEKKAVNLRTVADRVGLAPCSVSAVLNNTPASLAIPQHTKDRIFRAAEELNYRPNLWARSLRTKRTRMVAVVTSDIGRGAVARVVAGIQSFLHRRGYLLVLATVDSPSEWSTVSLHLQQRGVEGLIAMNASLPRETGLPVASIDLDFVISPDHSSEGMKSWLSDLGESAAETILRQIEKDSAPRRMKVAPKFPSAFFELPNTNLGAGARERA